MDRAGLSGQTVQALLESMASARPDPAAGSAAALTAAMGAALVTKAAGLSRRHLEHADLLAEQAEGLRIRALALAEEDASAVAHMGAAVRPSAADAARGQEVRATVADAIAVPRQIGEVAAEVGDLAAQLGRHGNPRLQADAEAARHLADAAAATAAAIVRSNQDLLE